MPTPELGGGHAGGASSSRLSAARRPRGRSRRGRSRANACGASACSWSTAADDPEATVESARRSRRAQELGLAEGQNIRIDYRFGAGDADRMAAFAKELVALKPDVILHAEHPCARGVARWRRRRTRSRSYSSPFPIRSARASPRVLRGRAAMSPDFTNVAVGDGWQMGRTTQRNCAGVNARSLHLQPTDCPLGGLSPGRNRSRCAHSRRDRDPRSRSRAVRHRGRRDGAGTRARRRPACATRRFHQRPSRADLRAGGCATVCPRSIRSATWP